jgi:hypothetical protein
VYVQRDDEMRVRFRVCTICGVVFVRLLDLLGRSAAATTPSQLAHCNTGHASQRYASRVALSVVHNNLHFQTGRALSGVSLERWLDASIDASSSGSMLKLQA